MRAHYNRGLNIGSTGDWVPTRIGTLNDDRFLNQHANNITIGDPRGALLSHRTRSDIQGVAIHDYYFIERCLEGCPRGRLGTAITVVTVDRVDVETGRGEPVLEGFQSDCFFAFGGFG